MGKAKEGRHKNMCVEAKIVDTIIMRRSKRDKEVRVKVREEVTLIISTIRVWVVYQREEMFTIENSLSLREWREARAHRSNTREISSIPDHRYSRKRKIRNCSKNRKY
jgi:hypothetical protein